MQTLKIILERHTDRIFSIVKVKGKLNNLLDKVDKILLIIEFQILLVLFVLLVFTQIVIR